MFLVLGDNGLLLRQPGLEQPNSLLLGAPKKAFVKKLRLMSQLSLQTSPGSSAESSPDPHGRDQESFPVQIELKQEPEDNHPSPRCRFSSLSSSGQSSPVTTRSSSPAKSHSTEEEKPMDLSSPGSNHSVVSCAPASPLHTLPHRPPTEEESTCHTSPKRSHSEAVSVDESVKKAKMEEEVTSNEVHDHMPLSDWHCESTMHDYPVRRGEHMGSSFTAVSQGHSFADSHYQGYLPHPGSFSSHVPGTVSGSGQHKVPNSRAQQCTPGDLHHGAITDRLHRMLAGEPHRLADTPGGGEPSRFQDAFMMPPGGPHQGFLEGLQRNPPPALLVPTSRDADADFQPQRSSTPVSSLSHQVSSPPEEGVSSTSHVDLNRMKKPRKKPPPAGSIDDILCQRLQPVMFGPDGSHSGECHVCQVCGDVAAGFHCGAYVCEACKVSTVICLQR